MRVGVGVGVGECEWQREAVKTWRESFQTAPHAVGRCLKLLVQDAYGHGLRPRRPGHAAFGTDASSARLFSLHQQQQRQRRRRRRRRRQQQQGGQFMSTADVAIRRGRQRCRVTPRRSTLQSTCNVPTPFPTQWLRSATSTRVTPLHWMQSAPRHGHYSPALLQLLAIRPCVPLGPCCVCSSCLFFAPGRFRARLLPLEHGHSLKYNHLVDKK
jgi:hypothetical protein